MSDLHRTLADDICRFLIARGVRRIYGAPGTTDLALVASAAKAGLEYFFAPHDGIAVGAADGYARASRQVGVVNLHASQGILNAAGHIRAALRDEVPLLIISGQPATHYSIFEPNHYTHNLHSVLSAITKWSYSITQSDPVPAVLTRALAQASSPPYGPTALLVPQDVLEGPAQRRDPPDVSDRRPVAHASLDDLVDASRLLVRASNPLVFAGYGFADSVAGVEALSSALGAPVIAESSDRGPQLQGVYCTSTNPLFAGFYSSNRRLHRDLFDTADVLLVLGGKATYPRVLGDVSTHCSIIHLSHDPSWFGVRHRADVPLLGDLSRTLDALLDHVTTALRQAPLTEARHALAASLATAVAGDRAGRFKILKATELVGRPITPLQLVKALQESLPPDSVLVDDSQCFGYYLKTFYQFSTPKSLFGSMASHLGWGLPAALGVKHARPEAPVLAIVGDNGFLFAGHALAAAASWSVPLIALVANNGGAVSLRTELQIKHATSGAAVPLATPSAAADLAGIARQSGVTAFSVDSAADLVPVLREAVEVSTRSMRPCLIDVHMTQELSDWSEAWSVK